MKKDAKDGMPPAPPRAIQVEDVVGYRYTVRDESGKVLAVSGDIAYFLQGGDGPNPAGLAGTMEGRSHGERFTAVLAPEEAFGRVDHAGTLTLPRERFPAIMELSPGMHVDADTPEGKQVSLAVREATSSEVTLSYGHPLAGRTLHFEVSIVSIRESTAFERAQGHADPRPRTAGAGARELDSDDGALTATGAAREQLLELRDALAERFSQEEQSGGLHDDLAASHGRLDDLRSTHATLLARLDAIVASLDAGKGRYDHEAALLALVAQLRAHEDVESALLQDVHAMDVGGEG